MAVNYYGDAILEYMDKNDMTQKQFGEIVGIPQSRVSDIIHGYVIPKKELIDIISEKTEIVFKEPAEPMETVPVEAAAYELGMSVQNLKECLREQVFDYQFGVKAPGFNRYTIWRTKLDKFKKM